MICLLLAGCSSVFATDYTIPSTGSSTHYTLETGDSITADYTGGTSADSSGTVTLNGAASFVVGDALSTLRQTGVVSGTGSFTKTGAGKLVVTGANGYTGGTTVSAGTLALNNTTAAGLGAITLGDANTGASAIRLEFNAASIANNIIVSNQGTGNVTLYGSQKFSDLNSTITLNRAATFEIPVQSGDWWFAFAGALSGSGSLTILGGGGDSNRLTIGADNSHYSGDITVQSGRLQLGHVNAAGTGDIILGNTSTGTAKTELRLGANIANDIVISGDAPDSATTISTYNSLQTHSGTLAIHRDITIHGGSDRLTFTGVWSGTGGVTISGGGRVTVGGNSSAWTGDMTIATGTIFQTDSAGALSGNNSVVNNGTFQLNTQSATINGLSGSGTVKNITGGNKTLTLGAGNATSTFSGTIQDSAGRLAIRKTGDGTQTLSGTLTYTGGTTVTGGVLRLEGATATGAVGRAFVIEENGTLELYNTASGSYAFSQGNLTGSGVLKLSGDKTSTSHFNFTGATLYTASATNNFTGSIVVDGARFLVNSQANVGAPGTSITVQNDGQLYLAGTIDATVTISGDGTSEMAGNLGAIRFHNGILNGTVTLAGDAEMRAYVGHGVANATINLVTHTLTIGSGQSSGNPITLAGVISGTGKLVLNNSVSGTYISGDNTFSGGTTIKQGTVTARHDNAFGTEMITWEGGTLTVEAQRTFANDINVTGNVTLNTGGNRNITLRGDISGDGTITRIGNFTVELFGDNSGFTGKWIAGGQNTYFKSATAGSASAEWEVTSTLAGCISDVSEIDLGALSGTGTLRGDTNYALTFNIGGKNTDAVFSGTIQNASGGSSGGAVAINKVGTGVQTLSGTLNHTGGTFLSEGRLNISGALTGDLTANTRDGAASPAIFSPGLHDAVGAVNVAGTASFDDVILKIEVDASGMDLISANSLSFTENTVISIVPLPGFELAPELEFEFMTSSTPLPQVDWSKLVTAETGYFWNIEVDGNSLRARVDPNAVPEPTAWLLLIFGACGLWRLKKRSRA